jgi:hypothetical protein
MFYAISNLKLTNDDTFDYVVGFSDNLGKIALNVNHSSYIVRIKDTHLCATASVELNEQGVRNHWQHTEHSIEYLVLLSPRL